jgi:hypothetical protein
MLEKTLESLLALGLLRVGSGQLERVDGIPLDDLASATVIEPATTRMAPAQDTTVSGSDATMSGHKIDPTRIISRVATGVSATTALTRDASQ